MKRIIYILMCCVFAVSFYSCELFQIDNYAAPKETIKGVVLDVATGDTVYTDDGSEGIRIRLRELSWTGTAVPDNYDFYCMNNGTFQDTKVFKGYYNVQADGAFIPLIRINQKGDTLADESKYIDIKGVTEVQFKVQPFLKLVWVGTPTVSNGKVTATFIVTRAVSPADFQAKVAPMGGWNDNFLDITDVTLFVSESPSVGYRDSRLGTSPYSTQVTYSGNAFNSLLGQPVTVTSSGTIPAGRTIFVRAGARMRYPTVGVQRNNYNTPIRIDTPK
jgi:hypothetical protein